MVQKVGDRLKIGNPNFPVPGTPYTDGLPRWIRDERRTTVRRKKPLGINLLLSPTAHERVMIFTTNDVDRYKTDNSIRANPSYTTYVDPYKFNVLPAFNSRDAWGRALEKVQNNKFDAFTFLGELPEAIQWMAKSARDMFAAYRYIKTGRYFDAIDRWSRGKKRIFTFQRRNGSYYQKQLAFDGKLAGRYLEWRFAVSPLVNDLQSFLDACYAQASQPLYSKVTGRSSGSEPVQLYMMKGERRFKVIARGVYRIDTSAAALQRWGGINLIDTLWNLIPLSFMVDRFLPVGDFLANLDANMGVTWLSKTTAIVDTWEIRNNPPQNVTWQYGTCTTTAKGYKRFLGDNSYGGNFPSRLSLPKDLFTTGLDSLALTRQLFNNLK